MPTYITPGGQAYRIYNDMLSQTHLLIAGATGSGKSVVLNSLISTALLYSPNQKAFILLDRKGIELSDYRDMPHTLIYASSAEDMLTALRQAIDLMNRRLQYMRKKQIKTYDGSDVYIIIDELADLMTTHKREATPLLQTLGQLARAARIHLIACTQSPLREIIPTQIKCNFDARLGLRTATRQDSRNILDMAGCENLPNPRLAGKALGYYRRGGDINLYELPRVSEAKTQRLINYWSTQTPPRRSFIKRLFNRR